MPLAFPDAARIAVNPHLPLALHQIAWADMKTARGQSVAFYRLTPAHLSEGARPVRILSTDAPAKARVIDRLRAGFGLAVPEGAA